MNKHHGFILSSITSILEDAVIASSGINFTLETHPLSEYIMQSVFLKMTGFQEQKLKCIAWEMASYDYEYRRTLLKDNDNLGEYSSYKSKNSIYKRLIQLLKKDDPNFELNKILDKTLIRNNTIDLIKSIFKGTTLQIWNEKNYKYFTSYIKRTIKPSHFCNSEENLFESSLQELYKILYTYRNRYAHNTLSYQQNLPTLNTLFNPKYPYHNFFIWFSQLIIIDEIFMSLYSSFLKKIEDIED